MTTLSTFGLATVGRLAELLKTLDDDVIVTKAAVDQAEAARWAAQDAFSTASELYAQITKALTGYAGYGPDTRKTFPPLDELLAEAYRMLHQAEAAPEPYMRDGELQENPDLIPPTTDEAPAPKRKRRTKAEMEAARAAEAGVEAGVEPETVEPIAEMADEIVEQFSDSEVVETVVVEPPADPALAQKAATPLADLAQKAADDAAKRAAAQLAALAQHPSATEAPKTRRLL